MTDAVERALRDERVLVCEAGTGTGKTLAYLVPAILSGKKTVVSTLVANQLTADLVSNVGLGQRFALGFDLPLVIEQEGDDDPVTRAVARRTPPAQALGDLAFYAKGNLISYSALGGVGLSTLLRFTAPTGNTASYLGEGASTVYVELNGTLRPARRWRLVGHVGALTPLSGPRQSGGRRERYDLRAGIVREFRGCELRLAWTTTGPEPVYPEGYKQKRNQVVLGATYFF